jgi:hypothetical protein
MLRLRFATARSLFEAFPELATKASVAPGGDQPIPYLRKLSEQGKFDEAVAFCAHLLPRREAVWWACGSVRAFFGSELRGALQALAAAELWVREPTAEHRSAALHIGQDSDNADPLAWLALSAGWSGGALGSVPQNTVPVPAYMTARAARIAILLAVRHLAPADLAAHQRACIADGVGLVDGDDQGGSVVRLHDGDRTGLQDR